jgi:hypothetical protein
MTVSSASAWVTWKKLGKRVSAVFSLDPFGNFPLGWHI